MQITLITPSLNYNYIFIDNDHNMKDALFDEVMDSNGSFECSSSSPALITCSSSSDEIPSAFATVVATNSITGKFSNIHQKYQIDSAIIGTGYHAYAVRECTDRATRQRHAVKSILKSCPTVELTDLHREVQLLKEMNHDNIVHFVDAYEDAEYLHIVTDLFSGGELFHRVVEKRESPSAGCFAEEAAARVLHQILTGVTYLHSHGIVHRDLKPENIMFHTREEDSTIKIIDFGSSRKHYQDSFEPYMSTIVGTSYFLAPEVLRKKYDKSCDLWSIGVIAFIMLCGYPPFNGENNKEVCDAIRRGKLNFQPKHWKGISKEAKDFIRRLLRANPRKRLTVDTAMSHPWIMRHNVATSAQGKSHCSSVAKGRSERMRKIDSVLSFGGIGKGKLRSHRIISVH